MTTTAVLAAGLAGISVLLLVGAPAARLGDVVRPPTTGPGRSSRVAAAFLGRPGALALRQRVWLSLGAAAALCFVLSGGVLQLGPALWLAWPVLGVGGVLGLGQLEPLTARRRDQQLVLEVPQALELMAACLAVGTPPRRACAAVASAFEGPVGADLQPVLRAVELGVPDAEAWAGLADHPQLGGAAVDLARSVESGTQMVEALRTHARAARERRRAALEQAARSVGVRSVLPLMTCFIPAFLLLGVVPTVVSAVVQAFP